MNHAGKFKCTIEHYNGYPAVRSSLIKILIQKSPAHYKYALDNPTEPTSAMKLGSAIHAAVLEPKLFKEKYVVEPIFEGVTAKGEPTTSRNAKDVKDKYDRWHFEQRNKGNSVVTMDEHSQIDGILKSLSKHERACQLMSDGHAEESFVWKDPETGLWCKSRPDFYRNGKTIVQFKTSEDVRPVPFKRDIVKFGYHIGSAMEMDALTAVLGTAFDEYVIIAAEKNPPYAIRCIQLGERTLQEGQELFYKGLKTLKKCEDTGIFPAYEDEIVYIDINEWDFVKGEE